MWKRRVFGQRRAAQTAIYRILRGLDVLIAPIIPFTAEEIWSFLPMTRNTTVRP
jgi:isoleucyl-tRNA synthetase